MAKDKKKEKEKSKKEPEVAPEKPRGGGARAQIFLIFGMMAAVVFLPTTIVVGIGMLPTIVAFLLNGKSYRAKAFGVGAMNLAGVSPFLISLWKDGQGFDKAVEIISNPQSIIVMYMAAALGHMINWVMGGIVGSIMYDSGKRRAKEIEKRQQELVERWGEEVTGSVPLDAQGFPVRQESGL